MCCPMARYALLLLLGLGIVSGLSCSSHPPQDNHDDLGPVGSFRLTERNGETITEQTLHGKVWVASFVFTRCTGPCPQVTATMARLQRDLADLPEVRLVTFTVDPEHDRARELQEYASAFGADPQRWLFLTGPEEDIHRLLLEGFHVAVSVNRGEDRKPGREVSHSSRLVVVDRHGHIRGYYQGVADDVADPAAQQRFEEQLKQLRQQLLALTKEPA